MDEMAKTNLETVQWEKPENPKEVLFEGRCKLPAGSPTVERDNIGLLRTTTRRAQEKTVLFKTLRELKDDRGRQRIENWSPQTTRRLMAMA